jgi:hypothetical protein
MSLLINRSPRAKVRPVHGVAKWVLPIGEADAGGLAINGTAYTVNVLRGTGRAINGYRLCKADGTAYDVNTEAEPWTCDCPDATFHPERPGGCKHVAGLRAALAAAGQK